MASSRDARRSLTSPYSIFLTWLGVRPNRLPALRSQAPFGSSGRRGTNRKMVFASTTACIVFPCEGERNSRIRDNSFSMFDDMAKRADTDTWISVGTALRRAKLAGLATERNCGDAAQLQAVPTDIGDSPDAEPAQAGQSQAQAPRLDRGGRAASLGLGRPADAAKQGDGEELRSGEDSSRSRALARPGAGAITPHVHSASPTVH